MSKEKLNSGFIEVWHSNSDTENNQDMQKLERDVKYSKKVSDFISLHKQWRQGIMANRAQSKDLYRTDNVWKKTWRALRQIVAWKTKQLLDSIPNRFRSNPIWVHAKIKSFLSSFQTAKNQETYYTLVSCMIFLARKRNYPNLIKNIAPDADWKKFMTNEAKFFRDCNENKKKDLEWNQIFSHPIFSLAKALFYRDEEMQDVFFTKSLGWMPKNNEDDTKTRMTIVDDYEYFRQRLLQTIEERFQELY